MFRDLTLGQYYPAESVIHRLDPRVKLLSTLLYLISIFVADSIPCFVLLTGFMIFFIALCHVPFSFMVRGLRGIMVLVIIAAVCNLFMTPGRVLWQWGILKITYLGLQNAVIMTVRMFYLIIGTSVMTLTTTPNQLTDGLETGLKPLEKIHVPVHEIAMMMSIALRFIPILVEETNIIMKAQMARGANFETGSFIKRAKAMIPILVPLFVSAFRRANDLALAMEARCYHGGDGRTKLKPLSYQKRDYQAYVIVWLYLVAMIILKILF